MSAPRAFLLDIEGTTTPIDFVTKTLFPYARRELSSFLTRSLDDPRLRLALVSDCCLLSAEHDQDLKAPSWNNKPDPESSLPYLYWLMDNDRKSTGLKSLQGRIWEEGYRSGKIQGEVYPDVWPALRRWKNRGAEVYIFSSGSVLAQQLLFEHLPEGDMTELIDGYFDTTIGPKREQESYVQIATSMKQVPNDVMFLSDVDAEVEAARSSGMMARLIDRTGVLPMDSMTLSSFESLP